MPHTKSNPVYTTIKTGPRQGQQIINWAATAESCQQELNNAASERNTLKSLLGSRDRTISELYGERDRALVACNTLASHWTAIFWPKRIWAALRAAGYQG